MDAAQIIRMYDKRVKDLPIRVIENYVDAQKYARKAGGMVADLLSNPNFVDLESMTEDEAVALFASVLRHNYDNVVKACRAAQGGVNRRARVGLGVLDADFDAEGVREMLDVKRRARVALGVLDADFDAEGVREIVSTILDTQEYTPDFVKNLIVNQSNKIVDRTIRTNAEAQSSTGLAVHIVRRYDDVGLHGGKDPCQWCLKRAGDWDDYSEAYAAGCFERHPGCGCVIEYNVGRTHTWSNSMYGWNDL